MVFVCVWTLAGTPACEGILSSHPISLFGANRSHHGFPYESFLPVMLRASSACRLLHFGATPRWESVSLEPPIPSLVLCFAQGVRSSVLVSRADLERRSHCCCWLGGGG